LKVLWTYEALERLLDIEDFIAQDNPRRARQFIGLLIEKGESLSDNPRRGRTVPEISNPYICELIVKQYRIVYRLRRDQIEILTVFEGHRQLRIDEI
jgi:plasmid stabilization system protein ParE